jgi:glyoxylase-like metal-dependent hydrolase (beta-lactamase superfamily II)
VVGEGEQLATDSGTLTILETPGHTPDHISLEWDAQGCGGRALFVGDLVLGSGDAALVGAPEGDVRAYLASLDRIQARRPARLYPGHGPPLDDPVEAVGRFRSHRLQRIEQVRRALAEQPSASVHDLVARIYGQSLDLPLRGAAMASVQAIVTYLPRVGPTD